MGRDDIAALICARLGEATDDAAAAYAATRPRIGHFVIDDLLPTQLARAIATAFPAKRAMIAKRSLRERKGIMAQMSLCEPLVEEALYAFQHPDVVATVGRIVGLATLQPDPTLYAGGISAMGTGDYLQPHLDNSHDHARTRWRALNLLFYVTPEWPVGAGGDLELWPEGLAGAPTTLASRSNRLIVMATHGSSWHSVSPVTGRGERSCISNYYFDPQPLRPTDRFRVTSFRGRPGHPVTDMLLRADATLRGSLRRISPGGISRLTHVNRAARP